MAIRWAGETDGDCASIVIRALQESPCYYGLNTRDRLSIMAAVYRYGGKTRVFIEKIPLTRYDLEMIRQQ